MHFMVYLCLFNLTHIFFYNLRCLMCKNNSNFLQEVLHFFDFLYKLNSYIQSSRKYTKFHFIIRCQNPGSVRPWKWSQNGHFLLRFDLKNGHFANTKKLGILTHNEVKFCVFSCWLMLGGNKFLGSRVRGVMVLVLAWLNVVLVI